MKEFVTRSDQQEGELDTIEFSVDGRVCHAYYPVDGQVAVMYAGVSGRRKNPGDMIAAITNFFMAVLDDPTYDYMHEKLLDPKDPFGVEHMQEIIEYLMSEWSGRPTQPSTGSTSSRGTGGQRSTPHTLQLT